MLKKLKTTCRSDANASKPIHNSSTNSYYKYYFITFYHLRKSLSITLYDFLEKNMHFFDILFVLFPHFRRKRGRFSTFFWEKGSSANQIGAVFSKIKLAIF